MGHLKLRGIHELLWLGLGLGLRSISDPHSRYTLMAVVKVHTYLRYLASYKMTFRGNDWIFVGASDNAVVLGNVMVLRRRFAQILWIYPEKFRTPTSQTTFSPIFFVLNAQFSNLKLKFSFSNGQVTWGQVSKKLNILTALYREQLSN